MQSLQHFYGLCERAEAGFWAEPINVASNFGFLVAAVMLYRYYSTHADLHGKWKWDVHILTGLVACIGLASITFHLMPNIYTEIADIAFIVVFIILFFFSALLRVTQCNWFELLISFVAFLGLTHMLVTQFPHAMNDSISYLSSMTALIMIAVYLNLKRRSSARAFLLAALIGVVSLFFRSVDNAVCDVVPIGTHFLWHLLNALLIYILMLQLIRNVDRRARMLRKASEHLQ